MKILLLVFLGIAWVGLPGALIGWITGFFSWHIVAAILWGLFVLYTYPRSRRRWGGKVDMEQEDRIGVALSASQGGS